MGGGARDRQNVYGGDSPLPVAPLSRIKRFYHYRKYIFDKLHRTFWQGSFFKYKCFFFIFRFTTEITTKKEISYIFTFFLLSRFTSLKLLEITNITKKCELYRYRSLKRGLPYQILKFLMKNHIFQPNTANILGTPNALKKFSDSCFLFFTTCIVQYYLWYGVSHETWQWQDNLKVIFIFEIIWGILFVNLIII